MVRRFDRAQRRMAATAALGISALWCNSAVFEASAARLECWQALQPAAAVQAARHFAAAARAALGGCVRERTQARDDPGTLRPDHRQDHPTARGPAAPPPPAAGHHTRPINSVHTQHTPAPPSRRAATAAAGPAVCLHHAPQQAPACRAAACRLTWRASAAAAWAAWAAAAAASSPPSTRWPSCTGRTCG